MKEKTPIPSELSFRLLQKTFARSKNVRKERRGEPVAGIKLSQILLQIEKGGWGGEEFLLSVQDQKRVMGFEKNYCRKAHDI